MLTERVEALRMSSFLLAAVACFSKVPESRFVFAFKVKKIQ